MMDKPILFSTAMVQAIMAGNKMQTRRIIKPQPFDITGTDDNGIYTIEKDMKNNYIKCPYEKGMKLWTRETWRYVPCIQKYEYKADNIHAPVCWKPSIFMPKEACRLWLEVTNVRAERLQDITEKDAMAEGIIPKFDTGYEIIHDGTGAVCVEAFQKLWDSINAKRGYPWESNPWVWVVEFKRI